MVGELVVELAAFGPAGALELAAGIDVVAGFASISGDGTGSRSTLSGGWISGRVGSFTAAEFPACACGAGHTLACANSAEPPHPSSESAARIALGAECLFKNAVNSIVVN